MHHTLAIKRWHVVISGFTQNEARETGLMALWRKLRVQSAPGTEVQLRCWHDRWSDLAELIHLNRNGGTPDVVISGYSFGGYSATILAAELERRGIPVRAMVLCDAVYRHWYRAGWWRSLMPWCRIRVPANVREVFWLRQGNPRFELGRRGPVVQPAGHDVFAADEDATEIHPPVVLPNEHAYMDDAPDFHHIALQQVSQ